jgi:TRAP-type transport system periplasmic protein
MQKYILPLALATSVVFSTGHAASAADPVAPLVMKIATAAQKDHQTEFIDRFKAAIEKDSKGRIKVEEYPDGVLGSIPRMIENTQFGAIQAWVGSPQFLTGIDRRYEVTQLPIFSSSAQAFKTFEDPEFNKAFLELGADKGLKGIALFYSARQGIVTRKPAPTIDDLKGLKVRSTAGVVMTDEMHLLGATAVPMPLDQVLPALQQGAIDGTLISIGVAGPNKYYTVAPNLTEIDIDDESDICVVSKLWFDKLPADLQALITADAEKVARDMYPWTLDFISAQRKAWVAGGGHLYELTPAQHKQLHDIISRTGDDVTAGNPDFKAIYDVMIRSAKKY